MSKVSIAKAAKIFAVSRPSLLDHIRKGKISAEKHGDQWQIDMAELARAYQRRDGKGDTNRHGGLPMSDTTSDTALHAEIKVLQAKLEAEREARQLVERHLEDLRALLPSPEDRPARRSWWGWKA